MATYKQDLNLPSHGRRAKADNAGTIRVHITRREGLIIYMAPQAFDFYLNIDTQNGTYHATIEVDQSFPPKKEVTSIEVPQEVLTEVVKLAQNKDFLALNNDNIFPNMVMADGNDVSISVKTDDGNVSLDSNMLEDTLWNGFIPVGEYGIETPFDKLVAPAFEMLGIETDEYDEDEEE